MYSAIRTKKKNSKDYPEHNHISNINSDSNQRLPTEGWAPAFQQLALPLQNLSLKRLCQVLYLPTTKRKEGRTHFETKSVWKNQNKPYQKNNTV